MDDYRKDDHERIITSGAWFATLAVSSLLAIADAHMIYILGWLLNTTIILGVSYAMAKWKRAWFAWLAFWGLAAICVLCGILKAATPWLNGDWSGGTQAMAWLIVGCWYWLLRAPRLHPPAPPIEQHVWHHHVVHGPDGQTVGWGQSMPGPVMGGAVPPQVDQGAPKALESYAVHPGAFIGRRGELLARLKQIKGK